MATNADQIAVVKTKLDSWLGIAGEQLLDSKGRYVEFQYKSPTGIILFSVGFHLYQGKWQFANRTLGLPCDVDQIKLFAAQAEISDVKVDTNFQTD